jgi:hypothetical protein
MTRVTIEDIENEIESEHYFSALDGARGSWHKESNHFNGTPAPLDIERLTFCVLVMKNGFVVTGESACVSMENFDALVGRRIARENAVDKVWPLLGYALRQRLQG